MKTQLATIIEKHYRIIEKDESGLIPEWVDTITYNPDGVLSSDKNRKLRFHPKEYPPMPEIPSPDDKEALARMHKKDLEDLKKYYPQLTPEKTQEILSKLEASLVNSG